MSLRRRGTVAQRTYKYAQDEITGSASPPNLFVYVYLLVVPVEIITPLRLAPWNKEEGGISRRTHVGNTAPT